MRQMLVLTLYRYTLGDIARHKETCRKYSPKNRAQADFFKGLPEYVVSVDKGVIVHSDYYFQFTGPEDVGYFKDDGIFFILMDVGYMDALLAEEITEGPGFENGFNQLFEGTTLNMTEVLSKMFLNEPEQKIYPKESHFILDVEYSGSGEDFVSEISFVGYLDANMKLVEVPYGPAD